MSRESNFCRDTGLPPIQQGQQGSARNTLIAPPHTPLKDRFSEWDNVVQQLKQAM